MSGDDDAEIGAALACMARHYTPPAPPDRRAQLAAELAQLHARLGPQWGAFAFPVPLPANLQ